MPEASISSSILPSMSSIVTRTFLINKAVLPHLVQSNGNIVNCGSTAAYAPIA